MTIEERLQQVIGSQAFQIAFLQNEIEKLQETIARLKSELGKEQLEDEPDRGPQ